MDKEAVHRGTKRRCTVGRMGVRRGMKRWDETELWDEDARLWDEI